MDLFYIDINNFQGNSKHDKQHTAGRFITEYAAVKFYNIENPEIEIVNKKPKFKYSDTEFSISHSGDIAAVCFSKIPVGFDIEQIILRDYNSIAKRMKLKLNEDSLEEFYKCWTVYEASIKLHDNALYTLSKKFKEKYIFSIASSKPVVLNRIEEIKK